MVYLDEQEVKKAYHNGMKKIYDSAPVFASFAQRLGEPFFDDDPSENAVRAYVSWDKDNKKIEFHLNGHYITNITSEELGAVICHETYHILYQHLMEASDTKTYPVQKALINAHECIINDGLLDNVGLQLPDNVIYGTVNYDQDMSWFTTKQAYDFIVDKMNQQSNNDSQDDDQSGQNSSENNSSKSSSTGENNEDSNNNPINNSCGGVRVDPEDMKNFIDAMKNIIQDVVDDTDPKNIPDDLKDVLMDYESNNGFNISKENGVTNSPIASNMNMNWFELLAKINPKVRSAGRPKATDSWRQPNLRLISTYPKTILPEILYDDPYSKQRGKAAPAVVVALDLSGSIPRHLVNKLISLVDSVPDRFIKPYPVTWSDYVLPWDSNSRQMVPENGTNINAVYDYVEMLKKRDHIDPYVVVITDGRFNFYRNDLKESEIKDKWFWLAIKPNDVYNLHTFVVNPGLGVKEHIYKLDDFC